MTPIVVISLLSFVCVSGLVGLVALMLRDNTPKTADRLDMLIGKKQKDDPAQEILRKTAFENDKKSLLEIITPNFPSMQKIFEQADCHIRPSTLTGIGLILAMGGSTCSWLLHVPWYLAPLAGIVLFFVPFLWVLNKRRVRLKRFGAQLPDAMELVARALRAGHSLGAGMHVVAEEMPAPIADEFGRVYEEQNLGIAVEESLAQYLRAYPESRSAASSSLRWRFSGKPAATWPRSSKRSATSCASASASWGKSRR